MKRRISIASLVVALTSWTASSATASDDLTEMVERCESTWGASQMAFEPLFADDITIRGQNPRESRSLGQVYLEIGIPRFGAGLAYSSVFGNLGWSIGWNFGRVFLTAGDAKALNGTDVGSVMHKSRAPGVNATPRNPVVSQERVRASQLEKLLASGSYWFPARADLDTALSKIDSRLFETATAIKGPYTALYGPGFDFMDVQLLRAPRYEGGFQTHGSTVFDYHTNGEQVHGRQSVWGGSDDWGFRVGYGHRTGNDYMTGDDQEIPASYKSRTVDLALGLDITADSYIDFSFLRLDQTDVEFAGQMFDMDYLVTDGYELAYVLENQNRFDRLEVDAWYNRTRFVGNNHRPGKRRFLSQLDDFFPIFVPPGTVGRLFSETDVDAMSTGYRVAFTQGDEQDRQFTYGFDLRYLNQELNEFSTIVPDPAVPPILVTMPPFNAPPFSSRQNKPIPESHSSNPGLFLETVTPVGQWVVVRAGGRMDWVSMNALESVAETNIPRADNSLAITTNLEEALGGEFDQHFNLFGGFLSVESQLDRHWTSHLAGGFAMRPPTMTNMYAAGPFLATRPQFLYNSPVGNPTLDAEQLWQIDIGLKANYCNFRFGASGFHSWIHDYITHDVLNATPGLNLRSTFVNTNLATLAGGEVYSEADWTNTVASFAQLSYVEGRDHTRLSSNSPVRQMDTMFTNKNRSSSDISKEPLPTIPPLETRLGIRIHQPGKDPSWAIEFSVRIVDNQDRVAQTLGELATPGFTTYDIRSYWQRTDNLLLTAGVENLTDKQYREHFDPRPGTYSGNFFQPGITFYSGVEYTW